MIGAPGGGYAADAIVVLGGGVGADGSLPAPTRTRVEHAARLFHRGVAPRMILSGRWGLNAPDSPVTEAAAMAGRARALGVPDDAILLEEESRDTLGNAYFTRVRLLEPNGWRVLRVVTSDFHLSRAAWVFRKILGERYDFAFDSAASGLSPRDLIHRALEECRVQIFLNEWLEALEEGDRSAIDHLIHHEHPGYAEAPLLSLDEMRRRFAEIDRIARDAGTEWWPATLAAPAAREG